jgi:hypothetical protein
MSRAGGADHRGRRIAHEVNLGAVRKELRSGRAAMLAQPSEEIPVRFRLHRLVVVVIVLLGAATAVPAAWAGALCIEDTQLDPELGRALDRLVATAEVTVRAPGGCKADGARLIGRFSGREPVLFTLHTAQADHAEKFARAVPWLTRPDAALVRLRAQGRLSAFSVLVDALLAEQRIAAGHDPRAPQPPAGPAPAPAGPAPAPAAPAPAPAPAAPAPAPAPAAPAPAPAAPAPAPAPAAPAPAPAAPAPTPAAPEPAPAAPRAVAPSEAPDAAAPTGEDAPPLAPPAPSTPPPARTVPVPEPLPPVTLPEPVVTAAAPPAPVPAVVLLSEQVSAEGGRAAQPAADARVQASAGSRTWPSPDVLVAGRVRWPNTIAIEVGAGVAWRSLFARAAYQPSARWDFDGRLVEVSGFALAAGYWPAFRRGAWRIGPSVAAGIERITVQRADLRSAEPHPYWDPGVAIGGAVARDLEGVVRVTLHVEGFRSMGRTLRVPGGPELDYNHYSARAALSFAWLP